MARGEFRAAWKSGEKLTTGWIVGGDQYAAAKDPRGGWVLAHLKTGFLCMRGSLAQCRAVAGNLYAKLPEFGQLGTYNDDSALQARRDLLTAAAEVISRVLNPAEREEPKKAEKAGG